MVKFFMWYDLFIMEHVQFIEDILYYKMFTFSLSNLYDMFQVLVSQQTQQTEHDHRAFTQRMKVIT